MGAVHVREDIAPMIVVLNEISLREAHPVGLIGIHVDAIYRYGGNGVILGSGAEDALHPALADGEIVQRGGREGVRPGCLPRHLPGIVQGGELRHRGRRSGKEKSPENTGIDPVVLESLVDAAKVLRAVP